MLVKYLNTVVSEGNVNKVMGDLIMYFLISLNLVEYTDDIL